MAKFLASLRFWFGAIRQPKRLRLKRHQAEYVQQLLLSGTSPEEIGRAMDKMYSRKTWAYFKSPNELGAFEFAEPVAYDVDGIEYIEAALYKLGGYYRVWFGRAKHGGKWRPVSGRGRYCYNPDHAMVKYIAGVGATAPVPEKRG